LGPGRNDIGYIKQKSGGNLKGVKIAFLYVDYPFGQEPIGILKTLAEKEGFDLQLFPYPLPGNDPGLGLDANSPHEPDWIISWSLSNMHVIASREMKRNGISIDKYISVNWFNEVDIKNIGPADAKGIKRGTNVAGGSNQPLIQEIIKELYDKGKGNGDRKNLDDVYYNTGLAIWSIATGRRPPCDQEGRLAADAAEDQGRPRKHQGLRRQRIHGSGYRHPRRITEAAARHGSRCGTARSGHRKPTGLPRSRRRLERGQNAIG